MTIHTHIPVIAGVIAIVLGLLDVNHRDYIDGYYDTKKAKGYFHYFDL